MGSLRIKFWGTRGHVSSPRHDTAIFGGNTPCIQILYKNHLILVDSGFGIANLGETLLPEIIHARKEVHAHIFYTHFHWDHVQGLSFFQPIYFASSTINLYSPEPKDVTLANLDLLFDGSYSPFEGLMNMDCETRIHQISGDFDFDGLKITTCAVDHIHHHDEASNGQLTYAYRFDTPEGESLCIVTDHEARPGPINDQVQKFISGCDLLVHDGHFMENEYDNHKGWGHSTVRQALDNSIASQAKYTLLTHHAPSRADIELQQIHRQLMTMPNYRVLNFDFAREEIEYAVSQKTSTKKAG